MLGVPFRAVSAGSQHCLAVSRSTWELKYLKSCDICIYTLHIYKL